MHRDKQFDAVTISQMFGQSYVSLSAFSGAYLVIRMSIFGEGSSMSLMWRQLHVPPYSCLFIALMQC